METTHIHFRYKVAKKRPNIGRQFEVKNLKKDDLELTCKDSIKGNDLHDCLINGNFYIIN